MVESLPVSEDIKMRTGDWQAHVDAYNDSLRNLAAEGIETICYNFMPVLDWTRTDLAYEVETGATCMRFDLADFAAFDLFILKRDSGRARLRAPRCRPRRARRFDAMTPRRIATPSPGTWCSACRALRSRSRSKTCGAALPTTLRSARRSCAAT